MRNDTVKAVVQKVVPEGKHGPFAVATSQELNGSVTFSLEPTVWLEVDWPEEGMFILLGELRQKRAGWRAKKGRFWKPSDEQTERSRTMEPITFENDMMVKLTGLPRDWNGEGPYKVVKVLWVDRKCNCGADYYIKRPSLSENLGDYDKLCAHHESCNVFSAKHVGHHQLVTVQTPKGEVRLSGAWLVTA